MFGPRLTKVFTNRWMALWWAATILLLVWQVVPSPEDDADSTGAPVARASVAAAPANPWALDKR